MVLLLGLAVFVFFIFPGWSSDPRLSGLPRARRGTGWSSGLPVGCDREASGLPMGCARAGRSNLRWSQNWLSLTNWVCLGSPDHHFFLCVVVGAPECGNCACSSTLSSVMRPLVALWTYFSSSATTVALWDRSQFGPQVPGPVDWPNMYVYIYIFEMGVALASPYCKVVWHCTLCAVQYSGWKTDAAPNFGSLTV